MNGIREQDADLVLQRGDGLAAMSVVVGGVFVAPIGADDRIVAAPDRAIRDTSSSTSKRGSPSKV